MFDIKISSVFKQFCPGIRLGIVRSDIQLQPENKQLWQRIDETCSQIRKTLSQEQIVDLPVIKHTRQAYLSLGKEPARYRCSAESLLRRIVKGKRLYKINNAVDTINLVSILSHFSIGCYDLSQLNGSINFDIGQKSENYQAIGRGEMNIDHLPVFRDQHGAFGSPTSDSERTMVTDQTQAILVAIIDFSGKDPLISSTELMVSYLQKFTGATNFQQFILNV